MPARRPDTEYWRDRLLRTKVDYQACRAAAESMQRQQPVTATFKHEGRELTLTIAVTSKEAAA